MTNHYGITLDRVWTEWAANYGASPTVAAAVFLLSEGRPVHDVMAKLTPAECDQVGDIVSCWQDRFPPRTPAAVEAQRVRRKSAEANPIDAARNWGPRRATDRVTAQSIEKAGTLAGTLAETARRRLMVEDLMKAGLSVRKSDRHTTLIGAQGDACRGKGGSEARGRSCGNNGSAAG
jgi:hypothetical protein